MAAKVPATIVTGFLGAGKTTLIRHLLQNAGGRRIALIVNEFGDLGIDGDILRGCGDSACRDDDVVELSNGCLCCTVADDFVPTIETLLARDPAPDHIVIETSGLALPQPLVRAFNWPEIATRITVDGVVTVVDGPAVAAGRFAHDPAAVDAQRQADDALDHESPLHELFEDQVACADLLVVSKADLMDGAGAESLTAGLEAAARPGVQVVRASHGRLPADVLLGRGAAAENDLTARAGHHGPDDDHEHDEFESFVVHRGEIADPAAFARTVRDVVARHDVLRLKGFAAVAGRPMRLTLQAVGPRVESHFDGPFQGERGTALVVIGEKGLDRSAIAAALSA